MNIFEFKKRDSKVNIRGIDNRVPIKTYIFWPYNILSENILVKAKISVNFLSMSVYYVPERLLGDFDLLRDRDLDLDVRDPIHINTIEMLNLIQINK